MQTSVENRSCSASDKMAKATLGKKDQGKKIHLNGCFTINWQCGSADSIEITLDEGRRQPISKPISTANQQPRRILWSGYIAPNSIRSRRQFCNNQARKGVYLPALAGRLIRRSLRI